MSVGAHPRAAPPSKRRAARPRAPAALADRACSGRFMVRVPPETHRELAIEAAEEGVSLNRIVSVRLARSAR